MIKVFFAEHGTKADLEQAIAATEAWVAQRYQDSEGISQGYLDGEGAFPERLPWLILCGKFLTEHIAAVERWATWARATVAEWPDDLTQAEPDLDALREMAATLERFRAEA
jgi:hypothetical protein